MHAMCHHCPNPFLPPGLPLWPAVPNLKAQCCLSSIPISARRNSQVLWSILWNSAVNHSCCTTYPGLLGPPLKPELCLIPKTKILMRLTLGTWFVLILRKTVHLPGLSNNSACSCQGPIESTNHPETSTLPLAKSHSPGSL